MKSFYWNSVKPVLDCHHFLQLINANDEIYHESTCLLNPHEIRYKMETNHPEFYHQNPTRFFPQHKQTSSLKMCTAEDEQKCN